MEIFEDFFPFMLGSIEKLPGLLAEALGGLLRFIGEALDNLMVFATNYAESRVFSLILSEIFLYWQEIAIAIALVMLFATHLFFPRWKKQHLYSYGVVEIFVGLLTTISVLPVGPELFNPAAYEAIWHDPSAMIVTILKLVAAYYLSTRGQENMQTAKSQKELPAGGLKTESPEK